jgi:hypothetical protein
MVGICEECGNSEEGIENEDCLCPYDCIRHGRCSECIENHREDGGRTHCGR